jgi:hypothetical protein
LRRSYCHPLNWQGLHQCRIVEYVQLRAESIRQEFQVRRVRRIPVELGEPVAGSASDRSGYADRAQATSHRARSRGLRDFLVLV